MEDLRDNILRYSPDRTLVACIRADDEGIIAGTNAAGAEIKRLGLSLESILIEGSQVRKDEEVARFYGSAKQVLMIEDVSIGLIAKPSGIATAAHKAVASAQGKPKIVCGAWKKIPLPVKEIFRSAVLTGGAWCRITSQPFVYIDKNYVKIFGGIKESLKAVQHLDGYLKIVQLSGTWKDIAEEAFDALVSGAGILFVDTGRPSDVKPVVEKLLDLGCRERVDIAFGGGVRLEDIGALKALDIDILCIGRQIIDAPLLDMKLEVIGTTQRNTEGLR